MEFDISLSRFEVTCITLITSALLHPFLIIYEFFFWCRDQIAYQEFLSGKGELFNGR